MDYWWDNKPSEPAPSLWHTCEFPDTGMRKSWCKECGCEAEYDIEVGRYVDLRLIRKPI